MSDNKSKPVDLGNLDLGMVPNTRKVKNAPAYKETGHKQHISAANKAKAKADSKVPIKHTSRNVKKTPKAGKSEGGALIPPTAGQILSVTDKESAIARLQEIAGSSHEQSAIRACKELIDHFDGQQDPTERIDPAAVCSYISRAQLYGDDPAKVLLRQHGLYKVAKALALSLGLERVTLVLDGETGDYSNSTQ